MGQNFYVEQREKSKGHKFDHESSLRKSDAKKIKRAKYAPQINTGKFAKIQAKTRYKEKVQLKQKIKTISQKETGNRETPTPTSGSPLPVFLMEDSANNPAKALSQAVKERRKSLAKKTNLIIPKVPVLNEFEVIKELRAGKKNAKSWKRIVRKCTFVGEDFTRKPPKYEKYIRPSALRLKKAHVTHPLLKTTFQLDILGVKENPHSKLFSGLGVMTKGSVIEVNVVELGCVTVGGKIIWGKYAQITNKPEQDGCVNAVLLV